MRRGPPACEVLAGLWLCATSTASVPATSIKIVQRPFLTSHYSPVRHTASATPASGSGWNAQTRRPGYANADGFKVCFVLSFGKAAAARGRRTTSGARSLSAVLTARGTLQNRPEGDSRTDGPDPR